MGHPMKNTSRSVSIAPMQGLEVYQAGLDSSARPLCPTGEYSISSSSSATASDFPRSPMPEK